MGSGLRLAVKRNRWLLVLALLVVGSVAAGCADTSSHEAEKVEPATIAEVPDSDLKEITLTRQAAERIDLQMTQIVDRSGTKVIPYAALVYDPQGVTWVYTSPKPLTYVRTPVTVASIAGKEAHLSAGPSAGTEVVTVGTAELYGTENEIGH